MSKLSDKNTALITGASSGIGREFALCLARDKRFHALILTARREERLERVREEVRALRESSGAEPVEVLVLPCDLRLRQSREELIADIRRSGAQLTLLINNAGFGSLGDFADSDPVWEQDMLRVNCEAPVHLCRAFIEPMKAAGGGAVVNVCSTASFQPMPQMATYAATKAFLSSFSQALAEELKDSKIRVLAHCPGPTESEFHQVVGLPEKLSFIPGMSAAQVVEQALSASERGRRVFINGWGNACLAQLARLLPNRITSIAVSRLLRGIASPG